MHTNLTQNDLEALRQEAADAGDCDLSSLCNEAMWGNSAQRARAKRKILAILAR